MKYIGAGYLETKSQLPFVVGYIFMIASQSHRLAESIGLKKPQAGVTTSSELLDASGGIVEMMLTDQKIDSHWSQATSFVAFDGRMMYTAGGRSTAFKPGTKLDFGDFELIR